VLVSGGLTEHAADSEYEQARELLASLGAPLHVLPGNHDDRAALRRHFSSEELELVPEPAGFAVHALVDGELASHVQPVGGARRFSNQ
jgi:Icc protein